MRGLLAIILLFICVACSTTKYVDRPVPIETVRTEYVNQLYRDSTYIHDSIDRYISGDTVSQQNWYTCLDRYYRSACESCYNWDKRG